MGRIKRSRPETTVHKAARKARKQEKRVEGLDPAALIPIIVPGTHTAVNQLPQARRWLQDELELTIPRFSKISIRAVELLSHKSPATRAAHPFMNLTDEAKEIIKSLEAERDTAKVAGTTGDWWNGSHKKSMTSKMAKHHKEGREMVRQSDMAMKEMLGIETLGMEGFDHIGFEEDIDDDDLEGLGQGDDEGVDSGETVSRVVESKEGGIEGDQLFSGDDEEALVELMGETGKRDVVHNNAEDLMDID